jgi:hypothetical protein
MTNASSSAPRCSARSSVLEREVLDELVDVMHAARTRCSALEPRTQNGGGSSNRNGL